MGQILHGSAKTTHAVRALIRRSRPYDEYAVLGMGPAGGFFELVDIAGNMRKSKPVYQIFPVALEAV